MHAEASLEGTELLLIHSRLFLKLQPYLHLYVTSERKMYGLKKKFNKIFIAFKISGTLILVI